MTGGGAEHQRLCSCDIAKYGFINLEEFDMGKLLVASEPEVWNEPTDLRKVLRPSSVFYCN